MLKDSAISHYGTQQKLADELEISQSTVSEWGKVVPLGYAFTIWLVSKKKIPVDLALYPKLPAKVRGMRL